LAVNPQCGDYYYGIARPWKINAASTPPPYYQKAIELEPENWCGYYGLGMNTSRQGAQGEEKARNCCSSLRENKFNLWALNMIKMLDKLVGDSEQAVPPVYLEAKTEHFTLKFYNKEAAIVRLSGRMGGAGLSTANQTIRFTPEGP